MKGILGLLRSKTLVNKPKDESTDSMLFSTAFAGQGVDDSMLVPWEARAVEVGAKRLSASRGGASCCKACGPKTNTWRTWTRTPWSAWSASLSLRRCHRTAT